MSKIDALAPLRAAVLYTGGEVAEGTIHADEAIMGAFRKFGLQAESVDGPKGRMNYPDGFVSSDKQWLHFAFDDNRHRAVHYSAKLPVVK